MEFSTYTLEEIFDAKMCNVWWKEKWRGFLLEI